MLRQIKTIGALAILFLSAAFTYADEDSGIRKVSDLGLDLWVNKGDLATYYFGEDVAVYFRTSEDCYVVVYDINPDGNVSVLFPEDYNSDCYAKGGETYRIPGQDANYKLEISGPRGNEYIYAVASYDHIRPPDFIKHAFYDYSDWGGSDNDFIGAMSGSRNEFVARLNDRIVDGPYTQASTSFYIDDNYRHNRWYRHWHYDPYYVGSVWVGVDWPGCEVWIDGIYWGIGPCLVPQIYIGRHWLWIYYNGYPYWQRDFYVTGGHRCYVDAKIDRRHGHLFGYDGPGHGGRFGDGKIRRWDLNQDKYRNEPDFKQELTKHPSDPPKHMAQPPLWVKERYSSRYNNQESKNLDHGQTETGRAIDKFRLGDEAKSIDKSNQVTRNEARPIENDNTKAESGRKVSRNNGIIAVPVYNNEAERKIEQPASQPSRNSQTEARKIESAPDRSQDNGSHQIEQAPQRSNDQPREIRHESPRVQPDSPKPAKNEDNHKRGKR